MPNPSLFGRNRFWWIACLLLFLAALSRYLVYDRSESVPHDPESFRLARSIAETGQFANPFAALDTGPSAHMGPAFPAFVAFLIHVFGDGTAGMYAIKFSAVLLLAVQLALFPFFSRALGMGELNGMVAACIWIAAKATITGLPNHQQTPMFGWESLYAAIFLAIATCIFRRYLDSPAGSSTRLAALVGCAMGVCLFFSPSVAIVFAGFLVLLLQRDKLAVFQKPNLLLIALPAVILAPWIVRNFIVFHRFIFVRDNLGLELSISNNDCASFGIAQNIDNGCFLKMHPNVNVDEARRVLAYGEPAYNDAKLREGLSWIRTHPGRFSALSALRVAAFWMPPATGGPYSLRGTGRRLERLVVYFMTPLSLVGLFMLFRKDRLSAWLCVLCLGLFPLVYYAVQYEYRYRYTILWVTFLLGSLPVTSFAQRMYQSILGRPQEAQETIAS